MFYIYTGFRCEQAAGLLHRSDCLYIYNSENIHNMITIIIGVSLLRNAYKQNIKNLQKLQCTSPHLLLSTLIHKDTV